MKTNHNNIITLAAALPLLATVACAPDEPFVPDMPDNIIWDNTVTEDRTKPPVAKDGCVAFAEWPMKDACVAVADRNNDKEVQFEEAEAVTELNLSEKRITDPKGLECFKNVKKLNISNNYISDISAVKNMTGIEWLDFSGNQVSSADFSDFSIFYNLRYLDGHNNKFEKEPDLRGCYEGMMYYFIAYQAKTDCPYNRDNSCGRFYNTFERPGYTSTETVNRTKIALRPAKGSGIWIRMTIYMQDKSFHNGASESVESQIIQDFFAIEPYKSLKDYFGIVFIENTPDAISQTENIPDEVSSGTFYITATYCSPKYDFTANNGNTLGYAQPSYRILAIKTAQGNTFSHEISHVLADLDDLYPKESGAYTRWLTTSTTDNPDDPGFPMLWAKLLQYEKYQSLKPIYYYTRKDGINVYRCKSGVMGNDGGDCFNALERLYVYLSIKWHYSELKKKLMNAISAAPFTYASHEEEGFPYVASLLIGTDSSYKKEINKYFPWFEKEFFAWCDTEFENFLEYDVINDSLPY
jgi:hypothetical protein